MGFQVIQLHAAHGYFLSRMLSPFFNKRKDEFGKDRTMIIKLIVDKIRINSPNVALDLRISLIEGLEDASKELADKKDLISKLTLLNLDIISISNGTYDFSKELVYPPKSSGHGVGIDLAINYANCFPNILWNVAGNIWDLRLLPDTTPNNLSFSIGRSLIADPYFVKKCLDGNYDYIQKCSRENCCNYYSSGRNSLSCPISLDLQQD